MIGYHYTSLEVWEDVQCRGLKPGRIQQCEYDVFIEVAPRLPRDAIWVWQYPLNDEQACVTTFSVAAMHDSFKIVLLKVVYGENDAASIVCDDTDPQDKLQFKSSFTVGHFGTGSLPIDLLINSIPSKQIEKIWEINLLDCMRGRHTSSRHTSSRHTSSLLSRLWGLRHRKRQAPYEVLGV